MERVNPLAQGHIVVDVYACQQKREHPQPFSRPLHTDKFRRSPFPRGECAASATVLQAWSCQRNVPAQKPRTPSEFGRHSAALRRNAGGSAFLNHVFTPHAQEDTPDRDGKAACEVLRLAPFQLHSNYTPLTRSRDWPPARPDIYANFA